VDIKGFLFSLIKPAAPSGSVNLPFQVDVNGPNTSVSVSAPIATSGAVGLVKPDGTTTSVDGSGNLTANAMTLQHDGTPNGSQSLLNLKSGTGIAISDDGSGGIEIAVQSVATQNCVQSNSAWTHLTSPLSCAFSSANMAGNCILAFVTADQTFGSATTITLTDSLGNSYTAYNQSLSSQTELHTAFVAKNIAGGANTLTATITPSGGAHVETASLLILEYSGVDTTSPVDSNAYGTAGTSTSAGPQNITTASDGAILVMHFSEIAANDSTTGSWLSSTPTGTPRVSASGVSSGDYCVNARVFDAVAGAAGTYACSAAFSGAVIAVQTSLIALKAAVTVGAGSVTSVSATVPSRQSVTVSNPTTTPAIAITDNAQSANTVLAGPASGSAAAPTFRALVSADLPSVLSNPMTTPGDIIVGGTSGAPTRLAKGADGTVLTMVSGAEAWATPSGGGGSEIFPISSSSSYAFTAIVPANWSAIGSGGSFTTITGQNGGSALRIVGATGGGSNGPFYGVSAAVSGTSWTKTFLVYPIMPGTSFPAGYVVIGFTDGTKYEGVGLNSEGGPSISSLKNSTFANAGSIANANGTVGPIARFVLGVAPVLVQLTRSGSTLTGSVSIDNGLNWETIFSDTTPFLTPTGVCVVAGGRGNTNASVAYFESYQ